MADENIKVTYEQDSKPSDENAKTDSGKNSAVDSEKSTETDVEKNSETSSENPAEIDQEKKSDVDSENESDSENISENIPESDENKSELRSDIEQFIAEKDAGNTYTIKLTHSQVIFVIAFFILAGASIILSVAYGSYRTSQIYSMTSEINQLRQSTSNQQDQILQLSKKASSLQDEIDQLTQLEQALRRAFSIQPAEDDEIEPGQGGPVSSVIDLKNVFDSLKSAERRLAARSDSVDELQSIIRAQQALFESNGSLGDFSNSSLDMIDVPAFIPAPIYNQVTKIPQGWPASGIVTSPYGLRWGGTDFHPGIDIANDMGTAILATADGTVEFAGWNSGGYGNMVDIDHGNGMKTRYAHGSAVVVSTGQTVKKGQLIMYMGSTGFSTGPHVHYEVWVDGQRVNPVTYL